MFKKAEQNEIQPFFKSHDMGNIWGIERPSSASVSELQEFSTRVWMTQERVTYWERETASVSLSRAYSG
jgi:hypothetical protein